MAAQTQVEGRYLSGRPPYGFQIVDLGPHPNPVKAANGSGCTGWQRMTVTAQECMVCDAVSDGHVFGASWSPFSKVLNAAAPGAFVDASAQG